MINTASTLYDKLLNIYTTHYDKLAKAQKKTIIVQNIPQNVSIDLYLNEDEDDLPLECDEKVKLEPKETIAERMKLNLQKRKIIETGLKILTPNKLLTRLPILVGNNSYKLKNEIRPILYLLY